MYTTIITFVFFGLMLVEMIAIAALNDIAEDFSLKHYFVYKRIIKSAFIIEFTVFNFLFSFSKPEYVFQLVLQILGNLVILFYFFFDFFYLSNRKRTYLLWLQEHVFKETQISKIFKYYDANDIEYKEYRKLPQQTYSLVKAGKDKGPCIYGATKDGGFLLKPIKEMNEETLMFYAQKLEIDFDEKKEIRFYNGNLISDAIKEFDYGHQSKFYLWIKNTIFSKKGILILKIIGISVFLLLLLLYAIPVAFFHKDIIGTWLGSKLYVR